MRPLAVVLAALLFACRMSHMVATEPSSSGPSGVADAGTSADGGDASNSGAQGAVDAGAALDAGISTAVSYGDACNAAGWCWENPLPQVNDPSSVYAVGENDVWVAGAHGMLVHWDGKIVVSFHIADVDLNGLWGAGPDDLWVVGNAGFAAHWDGMNWNLVPAGAEDLHGVYGADGELWVVGSHATALRWDGSSWIPAPAGPSPNADYRAVWFDRASDVWVAGPGPFHFDGSTWTTPEMLECADFRCTEQVTPPLRAIWGRSALDVWAVAGWGFPLWHWDGSTWKVSRIDDNCAAIGGTPDQTWCFGEGAMSSLHAGTWTRLSLVPVLTKPVSVSIAGSELWVAGQQGWGYVERSTILRQDANGSWTDLIRGPELWLSSVWGSGANDVWAGGDGPGGHSLLHFDGTAWTAACAACVGRVMAIGGSGQRDVWVELATWTAGIELQHWDGTSWETSLTLPPTSLGLSAIWASGPSDAWGVGENTTIHRNGTSWISVETGAPFGLFAVWGTAAADVWAGGRGALAHWNGTQWSVLRLDGGEAWSITSIWGSGPNDVWAAGYDGSHSLMLHFDGSSWTRAGVQDIGILMAISGTSASDVYAVATWATAGAILHWDGNVWTVADTGASRLSALWGSPGVEIIAVGAQGAILRNRKTNAAFRPAMNGSPVAIPSAEP